MTHRGHSALFLIVIFAALPLCAQTNDDRIQQLEQRLNALQQQTDQLRQELNQLKGTSAPASTTEDLTKVGVVAPAPPEVVPPPAGSLSDIDWLSEPEPAALPEPAFGVVSPPLLLPPQAAARHRSSVPNRRVIDVVTAEVCIGSVLLGFTACPFPGSAPGATV